MLEIIHKDCGGHVWLNGYVGDKGTMAGICNKCKKEFDFKASIKENGEMTLEFKEEDNIIYKVDTLEGKVEVVDVSEGTK